MCEKQKKKTNGNTFVTTYLLTLVDTNNEEYILKHLLTVLMLVNRSALK